MIFRQKVILGDYNISLIQKTGSPLWPQVKRQSASTKLISNGKKLLSACFERASAVRLPAEPVMPPALQPAEPGRLRGRR